MLLMFVLLLAICSKELVALFPQKAICNSYAASLNCVDKNKKRNTCRQF